MEESALEPRAEIDVHCGGIVLLLRFFIFVESIYSSVVVLHNAQQFFFGSLHRAERNDILLIRLIVDPFKFFAVDFSDSRLYTKFMLLLRFARKDRFVFCFYLAYRLKILALPAEAFTVFTV